MKAFVIVIRGHPDSERAAARCIESGKKFGVCVERFDAITPADNPAAMFAARGWPTGKFTNNRYSRPEPCMSCFLSHAALWHACAYSGESHLILEHDAVIVAPLPVFPLVRGPLVCNLGRPSFGVFRTPKDGFQPLVSKPFVPGAHAVYFHHWGASKVLAKIATDAEPTDVYLSRARFPFIEEFMPWPVVCEDDVSTVQGPTGIVGKHRPVVIV